MISFFFSNLITDIISFDSNNSDLILKICMEHEIFINFTCITLHFCYYDPKIP